MSPPCRDSPKQAEGHYRDALALAEELGMRPLVAHCHLGLGKLYRRTGAREQVQEHVAMATTMYRDMGMTYWLERRRRRCVSCSSRRGRAKLGVIRASCMRPAIFSVPPILGSPRASIRST